MPSGLNMAFDPILNSLNILTRVVQLLSLGLLVRGEMGNIQRFIRGRRGDGPTAMLNTRGDIPRQGVFVRVSQVQVMCASRAVKIKKRMHVLDFPGVRVHATGCLAGLDVAPDHRHHVSLVVHEACVKVGHGIRIGGGDVGESPGEGVLEEVKHGEEVPGRHEHVVSEPAGNDRVMHDWLVRLVLEVRLPALFEVRSRPGLEVAELLFGWADLDACFDAVCGERAGTLEIPLVKDAYSVSLCVLEEIEPSGRSFVTYASVSLDHRGQSRQRTLSPASRGMSRR